jgi:hypothetical protein
MGQRASVRARPCNPRINCRHNCMGGGGGTNREYDPGTYIHPRSSALPRLSKLLWSVRSETARPDRITRHGHQLGQVEDYLNGHPTQRLPNLNIGAGSMEMPCCWALRPTVALSSEPLAVPPKLRLHTF